MKLLFVLLVTLQLVSCQKEEQTIVIDKEDKTYAPENVRPVLNEQQRLAFTYFYQGADATSGLALEGNDRGDGGVITSGGSGFGLMAMVVGTERGWVSREDAAQHLLKSMRWLGKADRFHGAWSHWYYSSGKACPFGTQVNTGDILETSFLVAGLVAVQEYFNQDNAIESEIRDSVESFINTVDWQFYTNNENKLYWLWYSDNNRFELPIAGWNEGLETYLLALGAPDNTKISYDAYAQGWQANGGFASMYRTNYDYNLRLGENYGGPLFFSHYSFLGFNPMRMKDNYVFYWQQVVSHTLVNRHYCVYEAPSNYKYSERLWGLTACYGTGGPEYSARSPQNDDGVIAPTAALSSYPYTPFYSTQVLLYLNQLDGLKGRYGFGDALNPSAGTYETRHLAIDQGPIVVMIENYRSGLIWDLVMRSSYAQKALAAAQIEVDPVLEQGFAYTIVNTKTKEYDMMRHPDHEVYELPFYLTQAGELSLSIWNNAETETVATYNYTLSQGMNILTFDAQKVKSEKAYVIKATTADNNVYSLKVRLH